jgi:hypothetical protein
MTSNRNISAAFVTALAVIPLGAQAASTEAQSRKIENVLDKLEQRLIDKEASPLTFDETENAKNPQKETTKTKQKYAPKSAARISGQTPSGRNIQELQKKLGEYDSRIDLLEADVRKLRAGVYEDSATDNQVMLEVKAGNQSKFIIRTLHARLDGNTLYNQMDAAGLWMPTRSVPVFFGPLQPGEHRVDISATIAPLSADGLEMPSWKQKSLQQSFTFALSDGKARKSITIEINDSKGDGSQPVAKLAEADIK